MSLELIGEFDKMFSAKDNFAVVCRTVTRLQLKIVILRPQFERKSKSPFTFYFLAL